MILREADCCHSCEEFRCEAYSCWGPCLLHPEFDDVFFHNICDDFKRNEGKTLIAEKKKYEDEE